MPGFSRDQSTLVCDGVSLAAIADRTGTPVYVYSAAAIRQTYQQIDGAFAEYPHTLHYALKANSTMALARLLRQLGSAADANSAGEIEVALRAGFLPSQIVFTGVGKTYDELERAIGLGVASINAESAGELERIDAIARARGTRARVAIRINPDIDPLSHPHISTGLKTNKFGVPIEEAASMYRALAGRDGLALVGIHVHLGSQMTSLDPIRQAAAAVVRLGHELKSDGVPIEYLDLGGGLGVSYDGSPVPSTADYAAAVLDEIRGSGFDLALEPGRMLVASAGALLSRVVDVKAYPGGKRFVILDAGMTELLRPAMYEAFHRIEPVVSKHGRENPYDIVGPICESSDVFGRDRSLSDPAAGDLMAILDTGAYGAVMASTYNRRPLAPEVLVDEPAWRIVRRRQTVDDLIALEE